MVKGEAIVGGGLVKLLWDLPSIQSVSRGRAKGNPQRRCRQIEVVQGHEEGRGGGENESLGDREKRGGSAGPSLPRSPCGNMKCLLIVDHLIITKCTHVVLCALGRHLITPPKT